MFMEDSNSKETLTDVHFRLRSTPSKLGGLAKILQGWHPGIFCRFRTIHSTATGVFQKGKREEFKTEGSIEKCSCGKTRFVPTDPTLSIVECL